MDLYELEKKGDIDRLLQKAKSNKAVVRSRAVELIGGLIEDDERKGKQKILKKLADIALEDEDKETRKSAAKSLAYAGAAGLLVDEKDNQERADWALTKKLLKALEKDEKPIKVGAVIALGFTEDRRAIDSLIECLDSSDPEVRKRACISLSNLKAKKAAEKLKRKTTDGHPQVRKSAVEALGYLEVGTKQILKRLDDKNREVRKIAIQMIGDMEGKETEKTKKLTERINEEDKQIKKEAIYSLIETVSKAKDDSHNLREIALETLEAEENTTEPVIEIYKRASTDNVKRNAVWMLGKVGNEKAIELLIKAFEDEDERLQMFATTSLTEIAQRYKNTEKEKITEKIVDKLIQKLKNNDPKIRKRACYTLGKIGHKKALPYIQEKTEDENEKVRASAFKATKRIE